MGSPEKSRLEGRSPDASYAGCEAESLKPLSLDLGFRVWGPKPQSLDRSLALNLKESEFFPELKVRKNF